MTYLIDGTFIHQDSHGGGGTINPGDTQWMTAGRGILHIETVPESMVRSGGLFHGIQLWVNLPPDQKMAEPRYQAIEGRIWRLRSRRAARSCGSSRGPSVGSRVPARHTPRSGWRTQRSLPGRSCTSTRRHRRTPWCTC
ncbi:MAG: pirin family protein [Microthrixaceae bacterium]